MGSLFKDTYGFYRQLGWFGTLPLPERKKESPPTDFTGKTAKYPHPEHIKTWAGQKKYENGNICLRLAGVDDNYEAIGIDVDHYESGGKQKRGGDQIAELESRFGKLPDTWISSARGDGVSGIRYYRVPRGLSFRGKAAKDIDVISKGYRYAVVWPSIHPNDLLYQWFKPGSPPTGVGLGEEGIPLATDLPLLPDEWIDFLTAGRIEFTVDAIDMDSDPDQLYEWAINTFLDVQGVMCHRMAQKVEIHKQKIQDDPSSHDKLANFHWNLTNLALEGHAGFNTALTEIETYWINNVGSRGKRTLNEAKGELRRSRLNALRKVKAILENRIADNIEGVPPGDPLCLGASATLKPVDEYDDTHDGNGEHFRDLKCINGESTIYYISDWKKWIVWVPDEKDDETGRWMVDEEDGGLIRRQWWDVKFRQQAFVAGLKAAYEAEVANAVSQNLPSRGSGAMVPDKLILARNHWQKWDRHTLKSGDNFHAEASIRAAAKRWLTITSHDLNWNRNLIACANGVLEFDFEAKKTNFRKQLISDLITMNTGVRWGAKSATTNLWNQFLDKFLPSAEIQRMAQMAMGYTLMEGNPERVFLICLGQTSTGKSTFVRLCGKALGDYAAPVGKTIFQGHKFKPSLILNARKHLIYTTEFDGNTVISTSVFKEYSGSADEVEVERKGIDEVVVSDLNFVPLLATNQMPPMSEPDKAVLRRLYILPFDEIISKEDEDKKFGLVLEKTCLDAVLRWMVEGLIMYMQNGEKLIYNKYTEALVKDSVVDMGDPVLEFMESCLDFHEHHDNFHIDEMVWTAERPEWCIDHALLTQHFKAWWFDNDYQPKDLMSANALTRRFRSLGMRKPKKALWVNGKTGRYWLGVRFKPGAQIFTIPTATFKPRASNN